MDFWELKDELRRSFLSAKDRGFTDHQVNLARRCIEQVIRSNNIDVTQRYQMIPFMDLLEKNNYQYPSVIIAYNLLLQYVTNLLAPVLPPNWYSISTKSTTYAFRLARVKGSEDILNIAGYTKRSGDFRTFPEDKRHQPDREHLSMLATELLLARVECEGIVEKKYPKPEARSSQPHSPIQPTYQPASPHTGMPQGHRDSPTFQTSGGYYPSDVVPQYLHAPDNYLRHGSTEGSSFGFNTHTSDSGYQPPALGQDRFNKPDYPDEQHQQYMEQPSYYNQPTKPYQYYPPTGPDQYNSSVRPNQYNQYDSESKRSDYGTQSPRLSQERHSRELQDTGGEGGSPYTSGSQQASPSDSHQFSGSHSSGSQTSSPHSSQRFSGPQTHSPIPVPDEPLSSPQGEGGDIRRTKLLNRQQALLAKLKKLRADEYDPSGGPAPVGTQTAPVMSKVSETIPSLPLKEEPTVMNENVTKAPPVPKPRQRTKASTSANLSSPSPRFFQNTPMEYSNIPGVYIPQKPSNFETITEETTPDNQDSTAPMSPIRCSKCKCHLNDAGQCPYCSPHSENTHPLSDPLGPSSRPIPKPRKRTKIHKVNSNETTSPVVAQPNEPPLFEQTDISYLGSPDIPNVGNSITPSGPTMSPSDTGIASQKEPSNTGQSYYSQDSSHGSSGEKIVEDKEEKDVLDAYKKMHFKYSMEIEHFRQLSVEGQRQYLDDKRRSNDPITHLTPYYNGNDLHTRESSKDMEWFSSLTPEKQQEELDLRRQKGESVDHLSFLIKEQHVFQGLSELEQKQQRQQKLKDDGQYFIYWLKECTPYGFAPEEVEIALQYDYENPLNYLKTQWFKLIKHVQTHVQYHQANQSLGIPPNNEIRLLLIETNGNHLAAGKKCVANRKEKMNQLFKKLEGKLEVKWDDALESLCACDLDVEAAFYDVQCKNLKGLYDYMTTDYSHIIQGGEKAEGDQLKTENDYLKKVVMERMTKEDDEALFNSCLRMIMAECRFRTTEKAKMLIDLLKDKDEYPLTYYIDAAKNYNTFEEAQKYLNQPCPICVDDYPMDEMVVMPACDESLCKNCFKKYFQMVITEKSVKHFNCPMCSKPDLSNPDQTQGMNLELFVGMVKVHLEKSVYDMCQKKLTDFNLSKDPNFLWCPHENCGCGFINERNQKQIQCPECKESMCSSCKKKWEDQHKGISCEDFAKWKADNDPEAQKAGLAAHLNENGIQCPACKFRYDLARGGCMHFHCTQCPHEFCSGCSSAFKNGEACGRFANCKSQGLHAHHPRDCLFYLRDFSHQELQKILDDNEVQYDTDPPEAQINAAREKQQQEKEAAENEGEQDNEPAVEENVVVEQEQAGAGEEGKEKIVHVIDGEEIHLVCQVVLQKETPDGLKDEECLAAAPQGMAGLCKVHYKEYLVSKINKHNLDPIELYNTPKIQQILRRQELEIPEKDEENQESDDDYKKRLIEHVKEQLPIQRENPNPV